MTQAWAAGGLEVRARIDSRMACRGSNRQPRPCTVATLNENVDLVDAARSRQTDACVHGVVAAGQRQGIGAG